MADINKVNFDYIRRWEGKLSKDKRDSASKNPVPDGSGYHTNIGVTWQAFKAHFPNGTPAQFYEMPAKMWLKIYEDGYWRGIRSAEINSQAIGEFMADFAWGSGVVGAGTQLQKFLKAQGYNLVVDGMVGKVSIGLLNDMIAKKGERATFKGLFDAKVNFLKKLDSFATYGTGWLNRMNDFKAYAETIMK